jgi:CheY-like chemotaxis protein
MEKKYLLKKVMIVDDSNMDRFISTTMIKNNLFAEEVEGFSSVASALRYLHSLLLSQDPFPPIVFLDVNMPVKDGFDFLDDYLKFSEDVRKHCIIIMISATNSEEDIKRINTYPIVNMFFNKPLSNDILNNIRKTIQIEIPS